MRTLAAAAGMAFFAWLGYRFPVHVLTTRYIGSMGDACIAIWNMWHFQTAIAAHQNPLWTDYLYWPYGSDLILHHYTLFNDVVAFLLAGRLGEPMTHNLLYLGSVTLSGFGVFLILRDAEVGWAESFVAGAAFVLSPVMVYSGLGGFDLSNLHAPVIFVWLLIRASRRRRAMDCFWAALALSWVWCYNYYHFLFCVLLIGFFYAYLERPLASSVSRRPALRARGVVDAAAVLAFAAVVVSLRHGQPAFHGAGGLRQLLAATAPYLVFWALLALSLALRWRARLRLERRALRLSAWGPYAGVLGFWTLINLPLVLATLILMRSGDYGGSLSPWRGGGNPIDVLQLLMPNSLNPGWNRLGVPWAYGFPVGWALLAAGLWLWRRPAKDPAERLWLAGAAFSFIMSLGPWLKIAGVHTYLPLPFYFMHLLPIFSNIQTPHRFPVYLTLFLCLCLGSALSRLRARARPSRGWLVPLAGLAVVLLEFFPPVRPAQTFPAPAVVQRLADRPFGALLTLPTGGVFNGLTPVAAFGEPPDIILQTVHHKPLVGGYLTRVPRRLYDWVSSDPIYGALVRGQSGAPLERCLSDARLPRYLKQQRLRYILLDTARVAAPLQAAVKSWPVTLLDSGDGILLYEVKD